nr:unnamed protein product [Callosobruchus analis]
MQDSWLYLYDVTLSFNCKPRVKWPTRVTNSTYTLIDQIFLNFEDAGTCYVFDTVISDHRMVLLELDIFSLDNANHYGKSLSRRSFTGTNIDHFESSLKFEDCSPIYEYVCNDFSVAFEYFYFIVLHYFQLHFPVKKTYIANNNNKWVNADIKASRKDKIECENNIKETLQLLEHTGLMINKKRSHLISNQTCKYLGVLYNTYDNLVACRQEN